MTPDDRKYRGSLFCRLGRAGDSVGAKLRCSLNSTTNNDQALELAEQLLSEWGFWFEDYHWRKGNDEKISGCGVVSSIGNPAGSAGNSLRGPDILLDGTGRKSVQYTVGVSQLYGWVLRAWE